MKLLQTKHGANSTSGGRLFGPSTRYRRMPSSLRTTRTQPAPTTRRKGTRSFPGLHAADDTCPGLSAGVCIRYTRVRMPVAHKGEWRPSEQRQQQNNKCEKVACMRFSSIGGSRRSMHPSNLAAVPVISFIVLLCNLPLATAASTRSPRSCHLAVAGDGPALPAKSQASKSLSWEWRQSGYA